MAGRGVICALYGCFNYKIQSDRKSFYRFPRNKEICTQWVIKSKRADLLELLKNKGPEHLNKSYVVCSDHFSEKDFRNKNLLSQGIWPGAIPSQLIYNSKPTQSRSSHIERKLEEEEEESLNQAPSLGPDETSQINYIPAAKKKLVVESKQEIEIKEEPFWPEQSTELKFESKEYTLQLDSKSRIKEQSDEYGSNTIPFPSEIKPEAELEVKKLDRDVKIEDSITCRDEIATCLLRVESPRLCKQGEYYYNQEASVFTHGGTETFKSKEKTAESEKNSLNETHENSAIQGSYTEQIYLPDSEKGFKCEVCGKIASALNINHKSFIQEDKKYRCEACFNNSNSILCIKSQHLLHKDERTCKCKFCSKSFNSPSHLNRHVLIHESNKQYKCKVCEKSFSHLSNLKRHNLIHEGKKIHKCSICANSFSLKSHLKRHSFIHSGKRPYKCKICEKSFTSSSNLNRHILIHEGKRPYRCDLCGKHFARLSNMKKHNLIHEGKRLHKCGVCEKSFMLATYLKLHMLIHEGKKPHKCEVCGKGFTHLSNLKTHSLVHEGKRAHKCEVCGKSFMKPCSLKAHSFNHKDKSPHTCEICNKKLSGSYNLKIHSLIHKGERPHKCNVCEKSFTSSSHLNRHNLIHEGRKPHACNVCGKGFTSKSHLKTHKLIHERTLKT